MAENIYATRDVKLIAANVIVLFLSPTAVVLRLLSRRIARVRFGWDDYTIIVAMVIAGVLPIISFIAVHEGFGKHVEVAGPDAVEKWFFILYLFENFYGPAIAMVKFSILIYYKRIFTENTARMPAIIWFQRALYFMATVTVVWLIVFQGLFIFACTPIHWFWDHNPVTGHCPVSVQKVFYVQAIPNIATDLILLALPMPLIWKLQLPKAQRVALSGIFLLGSFVVITSIVRLDIIVKLTQKDVTWSYAQAAIWTSIELNAAVISACLPMLRPILRLASSKFGSRRRVSGDTAALRGTGGSSSQQLWNQPWAGPMPERVARVGGLFFRMSDLPEDPNYGEAWEMWDGGKFQRITKIERSNSKDRGDQEELGAIPVNAIRITEEIHCHDSITPVQWSPSAYMDKGWRKRLLLPCSVEVAEHIE